jgi:hypothetical protein
MSLLLLLLALVCTLLMMLLLSYNFDALLMQPHFMLISHVACWCGSNTPQ